MQTVKCREHGLQQECFVCIHLLQDAGRGFHRAPDEYNPRPDAWCDACQELLEQYGDWSEIPTAHPKVALVCGACYDLIRSKNELGPAIIEAERWLKPL